MTLRQLRISTKLKQIDMAKQLGIRESTISMWEKGKSYPSIPTIYKLAKILKVTPEEVFKSFEVKEIWWKLIQELK